MAKHEFGIMGDAPQPDERYEAYEPWKYNCICVEDDDLAGVLAGLRSIDFYWHTLAVRGKGLAYCGITLIPPESLGAFLDAIADFPALCALKGLLEGALDEKKWVIHYGI